MRPKRPETGAGVADADVTGQTVLVTGTTSGVGRAVALALGRLGATVLVHGRNADRGRTVVTDLEDIGAEAAFYRADFADLEAVRELAASVMEDHDLDVLVNNAGGYFPGGGTTADGLEYTIAVNHLAPFLLTAELLAPLRAAEGRVVTVSSDAHRGGEIDFDRFERSTGASGWTAYGASKLANVLFTRELARRLRGGDRAVTANCCHPGVIPGSGFTRNLPGPLGAVGSMVARLPIPGIDSVSDGAETPLYLAVSPEVAGVSGRYFADCRERTPAPAARDDETARRLWEWSCERTGVESQRLPAP